MAAGEPGGVPASAGLPGQYIHPGSPDRRCAGTGHDTTFIVFIDFVAAFDSVLHKLLDAALQAAGATDKSRAVFHAIYHKASAAVWVQTENGEETISRPFDIQRGVVQGDICSLYMYILAQGLAFLYFFAHDPEAAAGTGVTSRWLTMSCTKYHPTFALHANFWM